VGTVIEVSSDTRRRIHALFPRNDWDAVEQMLLTQCGDNLPLVDSTYVELTERIRYAVLKLSKGRVSELEQQIALAALDWRDTLMAAEFGHSVTAHKSWMP
jgi:hypothetical protein